MPDLLARLPKNCAAADFVALGDADMSKMLEDLKLGLNIMQRQTLVGKVKAWTLRRRALHLALEATDAECSSATPQQRNTILHEMILNAQNESGPPSDANIEKLWTLCDKDGNGDMTKAELTTLIKELLQIQLKEVKAGAAKAVIKQYVHSMSACDGLRRHACLLTYCACSA